MRGLFGVMAVLCAVITLLDVARCVIAPSPRAFIMLGLAIPATLWSARLAKQPKLQGER